MRSEGYCSWVCLCVCVCVCLLSHISPMERLFVLKTLSRTQRATKVKKFVGFSLKPLRCRDPALPPLYGHAYSRPFFSCTRMRISRVCTHMIHRRGFSTLVLLIVQVMHKFYMKLSSWSTCRMYCREFKSTALEFVLCCLCCLVFGECVSLVIVQ